MKLIEATVTFLKQAHTSLSKDIINIELFTIPQNFLLVCLNTNQWTKQ